MTGVEPNTSSKFSRRRPFNFKLSVAKNHTSSRGHSICNNKILCQEAVGHGHHERFVVPQLRLSHERYKGHFCPTARASESRTYWGALQIQKFVCVSFFPVGFLQEALKWLYTISANKIARLRYLWHWTLTLIFSYAQFFHLLSNVPFLSGNKHKIGQAFFRKG